MNLHPLCIVLASIAACSLGPRASEDPIATGPAGAQVQVVLARDSRSGAVTVSGELLAVSDSGLWLVVDEDYPAWAAFTVLQRVELEIAGSPGYDGPGAPPSAMRDRFRLASRYPQGVTPALLKRLLSAYGRDSTRVLHP